MLEKQTMSPKKPGHGHKGVVDVVLGAQWGDEGKGKLVSQSASHPASPSVLPSRGLFFFLVCLCACVCKRGNVTKV